MMKKSLLILCTVLFGILSYSQTTLLHYKVDGNLIPESGFDAALNPTLIKSAEMGYNGGNTQLQTNRPNAYAELSINTVGRTNLALSFYISIESGWGDWSVYTDNGSGGAVNTQVGETYNLGVLAGSARTINITIPDSALNKSTVKFRIQSNFGSFIGIQTGTNLRLDDIKILSGAPKIKVYSDANTFISHLSPAAVALNTDFGTIQTSGAAVTRTFRVRNYQGEPTSQLNVSNIEVSGVNAEDFSVTPTSLSNIPNTNDQTANSDSSFKTFNISFLPKGDGVRTAEITLTSNAAPSPYTFIIVGVGASCNLVESNYAENKMSLGLQTLPAKHVVDGSPIGLTDLIGGTSCSPSPNIGRLFPSNSIFGSCYNEKNLFSSATQSLIIRNTTKEIEFGGDAGLDISQQKKVSIQFNIAAFGKNNNGVNNDAYIKLSVKNPVSNIWSDEMILRGSGNSGNINYEFGRSDVFSANYDQSLNTDNNSGGDLLGRRVGRMVLNIPSGIQKLNFRIKAYTPNDEGMWLIDDVRVVSSNSEYRTYRADGKWANSNNDVVTAPSEGSKTYKNYKAVFEGNYTVPAEGLTVCECEVKDGVNLNILQNSAMTVRGNIINKGNGDNFIVASDANLIQIEPGAVNTGKITVQRSMQPRRNADDTYSAKEYSFYSSPVDGQNMKAIFGGSANNSAFALKLNEPGNNFINASLADYDVPGKGFAVKDPTVAYFNSLGKPANIIADFKGIPNNGSIEVPITKTGNLGWNLIGNPYPSNLDLTTFYSDNIGVMDATIRFWDKRVNNTYTQYGGAYKGYSYALYNAASKVGNPAPGGDAGNNTGTIGGLTKNGEEYRYAKVGQGFLIRSLKTSDVIKFNNNRRTATKGNIFFGRNSNENSRDMYRIQLITPSELALTQTVVYFEGGNNEFGVEDSKHPGTSSSDAFYSFADEEKVIINGRSAFDATDVIKLGTQNYIAGTYTIKAIDQEGVFENGQRIFIKDKLLNVLADLTEEPYEFSSESGSFTNRFEIVYEQGIVLVTNAAAKSTIEVYRDAADFVIRSNEKEINSVEIYDAAGRLIMTLNGKSKEFRFTSDRLTEGMYILKADLKDGEKVTKKIRK